MKMSKEKLQQEAASTGFKMEHLEKVFMLMELLEDFSSFPQLKDKFVLKGGIYPLHLKMRTLTSSLRRICDFLQSKKLKIEQLFLRFFSIRKSQLLAI